LLLQIVSDIRNRESAIENSYADLTSSEPTKDVSPGGPATAGRLVALDLGTKRVGVAVSDELRITARPLPLIERHSWKDLLHRVASIIEAYDARGLVIGLPLNMDGAEGPAAAEAKRIAENFRRSLNVPVYLQDERLTSHAAGAVMKSEGVRAEEVEGRIDSESAAIILRDFMAGSGQ